MKTVLSNPLKWLTFGLITFFVLYTGSHLLSPGEFSPGSDEGYYYYYAKKVSRHGPDVLKGLIDEYFQDINKQFYPPPTRIGHILMTGLLFKGYPSYWMLGVFSFLCFLLFLLVNFHYIRRYFGEKTAFWATTLLASSPLLVAMSRRALTDSPVNLLICWSIWLFFDFMVRSKKTTYAYFLVVFGLSLTFKESNVFLLFFFVLSWFLFFPLRKKPWYELGGVLLTALMAGFIIPGCIVGFERWLGAMTKLAFLQREVFLFNPYVAQYCSGPWYRYLLDFLLLSPWTFLLFLGYIFYFLTQKKTEDIQTYLFGYFLITYALMIPLQKNIRYVISLDMIIVIFSVLMLVTVMEKLFSEKRRDVWVTAIIISIAMYDFLGFIKIFMLSGLLDPITAHLLKFRGFIPHA